MKVPVTVLPQHRTLQLELFEVAPGVKITAKPAQISAPRVGMLRWVPELDGRFRAEIETHPATVAIKDWKESIYGCSKLIILALVEGGFVEGERISPRTMNISLESFFAHRARVRQNHFYWEDPDNRRRYTLALDKIKGDERRAHKKHQERQTAGASSAPVSAVTTPELPQTPRRDAARGPQRPNNESVNPTSANP